MGKTVKARYSKGVIRSLEKIDIEEGKEITITIMEVSSEHKLDAFKKSAGAWKGTVDAKKLIENIYADRLLSTREEPRLRKSQYRGQALVIKYFFFLFLISFLSIISTFSAKSLSARRRFSTFIIPWLIIAGSR